MVGADKLEPTAVPAFPVLKVRESEAARARLIGAYSKVLRKL